MSSIFELIAEYRNDVPVDVTELATRLGLHVKHERLSADISGSIEHLDGRYVVTIQEADPPTRQRFTIAHEIGHYVLHRSLIGDGIIDNRVYRSDANRRNRLVGSKEESEANSFAANLLMPESQLRRFHDQRLSRSQIASLLAVSKRSLDIRMDQLGFEESSSIDHDVGTETREPPEIA